MSCESLNEIIATFQGADPELRLELLLDYAKSLPGLPARLREAGTLAAARVPECQTPVFLFVEAEGDKVRLCAEVAEEAPTVRGFVSILVRAFDGARLADLAEAPADLLQQLKLDHVIRMTREVGLSAILYRLKREAARLGGVASAAQTA